jgi:dCMP deaminase
MESSKIFKQEEKVVQIDFNTIMEQIEKLQYRPSWDEYFMMLATLASKRSSCERQHVGCVIVKNNRVVATGYNGHIKGAPHNSKIVDGHEQKTIHAEANAVADSAYRGVEIAGTNAYVTHYPCINCAKMLIASGIKKIIYKVAYKPNELCKDLYEVAKIQVEHFRPQSCIINIEKEKEELIKDNSLNLDFIKIDK